MPSRRASATIFASSAGSKRSPCLRRTGVSIEIADTRDTTRPPLVWSSTRCTSSAVNVARARRQRHQREVAERLRAVALVLIEVAFFLDDDAARPAGERAHGHVVGERAGGHENRALFAEDARALLLELLDDAAERVGVGDDPLLIEQAVQQGRIFGGAQAEAVAAQPDAAIVRRRRPWRAARLRERRDRARQSRRRGSRAAGIAGGSRVSLESPRAHIIRLGGVLIVARHKALAMADEGRSELEPSRYRNSYVSALYRCSAKASAERRIQNLTRSPSCIWRAEVTVDADAAERRQRLLAVGRAGEGDDGRVAEVGAVEQIEDLDAELEPPPARRAGCS